MSTNTNQIDADGTNKQLPAVPAATQPIGRLGTDAAWWKRWRASVTRPWLLATCEMGAAAVLLAGIVLFLQTKQGTVRIEINDPAIEVVIDGKGVTIKGANPDVIMLEPGQHGLRIKYGELEFETDKFFLNRGETVTLKVEVVAVKVRVFQGDTVLGERPLPAVAPFDAKQAGDYQQAWAKHLDTKVEIENSLGMKLHLVPPGEFMMGSPQDEIDAIVQSTKDQRVQGWYRSEGPQHRVKLTQGFYLASCEVTQQQYQELMGVNPSHFSLTGPGKDAVKDLETGQHPVEKVSWFDAVDFCNKLSEKEQRSPYYLRDGEVVKVVGGAGYRLPTEAEWEYACRAGTTTRWSFGDNETKLSQHAWCGSTAGGRTHPVEGLAANAFGLYDVCGNVWEWCWDWHCDYGKSVDGAVDPDGAKTGSERVFRGGGWSGDAAYCRTANRVRRQPASRTGDLGFRVALLLFRQASEPARETGP